MKVIGVIPARWASTRLPGKSLVELCGKPLVLWVRERANMAARLDAVVVATDDQRIFDVVTEAGGTAIMTRPDHPSGTDRVAEAATVYGADVVVNIQGDEPLIEPAVIDALADVLLSDTGWDMATAAVPIEAGEAQDPAVVKVVCDEAGRALYFSRSVIPYRRNDDAGPVAGLYSRHLGIYAYRFSFLETLTHAAPCRSEQAERLEQLRALHIGARIRVIGVDAAGPAVDTPDDVAYAERAIREAGLA